MDSLKVKKIVAVCFLEAAKMALDHLGAYRMEQDSRGVQGSADLPRLYGDVRRLRDYLQACVSTHEEEVELDLGPDDCALLVASCRRLVASIDLRLPRTAPGKERKFLERKQQVISDWTVELAQKPLVELPMPSLSPKRESAAWALKNRLQDKLYPAADQSILVGGGSRPMPERARSTAAAGVPSPIDPMDPHLGAGMAMGEKADRAGAPTRAGVLVDPATMREPRLRALIAMDLRSLAFAEENGDYRIATVMLTSILEAAIIDYAVQRTSELGLVSTPDTWCPQEILVHGIGDSITPDDRGFAYNLFFARNMLKPAHQIVTPTVATSASVQRTREFVARMLYQLGYRHAPTPAPSSWARQPQY